MESKIYLIYVVALYAGAVYGSPTHAVEIEENNSDERVNVAEMFGELKGLIEESRDAVMTHIDEQFDALREEIKLSEEKEFLLAEHEEDIAADIDEEEGIEHEEENSHDEENEDICYSHDGEPVCGEFGECIPSDTGDSFTCWCEHGYYGGACELVDHCAGSACLNGGECINTIDGFKCECPDRYTGERCQELKFL